MIRQTDAYYKNPYAVFSDLLLIGEFLALPLGITGLLWLTSPNPVEPLAVGAAFLLLCLPWASYLHWRRCEPRVRFPLFAAVAFLYWLYYAPALFWGDRRFPILSDLTQVLPEDAMTRAVGLALIGVFAMYVGTRFGLDRLDLQTRMDLKDTPGARWYLRVLLLIGLAGGVDPALLDAFGPGAREVTAIVVATLPILIVSILFQRLLRRRADLMDVLCLCIFAVVRVGVVLASGALGGAAIIGLALGLVYISERRGFPVLLALLVAAAVVFLQPVKSQLRSTSSTGDVAGTPVERLSLWLTSATQVWVDAIDSSGTSSWSDLASESVGRLSLLPQTANVLELTPSEVPFQGAQLYSYLAVTWIPRGVWPDKPSANDSNRFYQVAYGLTSEEDLDRVSISAGALTEGYISFGVAGTLVVMLLVGMLIALIERIFLRIDSGTGLHGLGIIAGLALMVIEAQAAQYVGGFAQTLSFNAIALLPIATFRSGSEPGDPRPAAVGQAA